MRVCVRVCVRVCARVCARVFVCDFRCVLLVCLYCVLTAPYSLTAMCCCPPLPEIGGKQQSRATSVYGQKSPFLTSRNARSCSLSSPVHLSVCLSVCSSLPLSMHPLFGFLKEKNAFISISFSHSLLPFSFFLCSPRSLWCAVILLLVFL